MKNLKQKCHLMLCAAFLIAPLLSHADMLSNEPKNAHIEGKISQLDRNGFIVNERFIWVDKPIKGKKHSTVLHVGDTLEVDAFRGGVRWFATKIVRINKNKKRDVLFEASKANQP